MITEAKLRRKVGDTIFKRGSSLYNAGNVRSLNVEEEEGSVYLHAKVKGSGSKFYRVELILDADEDKIEDSDCDCPAFAAYSGLCKHCTAALLEWIHQSDIEDYDGGQKVRELSLEESLRRLGVTRGMPMKESPKPLKKLESSPELKALLMPFLLENNENPMTRVENQVKLEPHLSFMGDRLTLSFKIGITQMYILKNLTEFLSRVESESSYYYGKKLEFVHRESAFTEKSRKFIQMIQRIQPLKAAYTMYSGYYYGYNRSKESELEIDQAHTDELMNLLQDEEFYGSFMGFCSEKWVISEELPQFDAALRKKQDGALFTMRHYLKIEGEQYFYFPREGAIRKVAKDTFGKSLGFFSMLQRGTRSECDISQRDLPIFLEEILPDFQSVVPVKIGRLDLEKFLPETPEIQFYLDMPQRDLIVCKGYAVYVEHRYALFLRSDQVEDGEVRRNRKEERRAKERAAAFFDAYNQAMGEMVIDGENRCYEFLTEKLEGLKEVGEVFISDKMKAMKIRPLPQINVGLSISGNLLNLTLDTELPMDQLTELLSRYDRKKKYYRLKNGEFIQYDQDSLNSVSDILKALQVSEKALRNGAMEAPRYRALYLDEKLKEKQGISVEKGRSYKSLIRNMKTVEDSDFDVPDSLKKVLRGYQKKGFFWLKTLCQNGFGGILADDMGLGKTLQVIAFLLSETEAGEKRRSLIVAPASLVYNWENEIRRFAPALKVRVLAGTAAERKELLKQSTEGEILVTSYELLRRDQELYQDQEFFCEVIDEAQYIKNAGTKGARAVKAVSAQVKLALTGTPVENRLSELWSIFDYLMPGFLYSYEHFKKAFETPIMKNQEEETMKNLQRMIQPFILRRLKKEVLADLPDKIEKNTYIPLEGEQRKLYEAHVQRLKLMLENGSDETFGEIRMQVLAELTRLRQLCCDPSLIYQDYEGGSAKVELCLELIRNAINGGHKVLLFSQFTSMLEILEKRMADEEISFYSLTGSTPKKERVELMEAFNRDETSVFCISLKAGGTGLNLTGADMVIHHDPWWNVAAENQATDRAHRIGQEKVVTVYKLVAEHTIEEKVIELQQKKKELADQVLSGEEMGSMHFDREEILKLFEEHEKG